MEFMSAVVQEHFGLQMAILIRVLLEYKKQDFNTLTKLLQVYRKTHSLEVILNAKIIQFLLMIGIKHQLISYDSGTYCANEAAILGRELLPEFMVKKPQYNAIIHQVIQNGVFSVKSTQNYDLVLQMVEEDFVNQIGDIAPIETSKKAKKLQKHDRKLLHDDTPLQLNFKAILEYLRQEAILDYMEISGESAFFREFLQIRKISAVEIPITEFKNTPSKRCLSILGISSIDGSKTVVPQMANEKLFSYVRSQVYFKFISDKYSPLHARVIQILKEKKKADEKILSDVALIDLTIIRSILQELVNDQVIHCEQLKGENNRSTQQFVYQGSRIDLRAHMFKCLYNVHTRGNTQLYLAILRQLSLI